MAFLLSICVLLEVLAYTYMQQQGGTFYFSSSIIYFLAGLGVCILPLLPTNRRYSSTPLLSKYLRPAFYVLLGGMLLYHLSILIPLFKSWPVDRHLADMLPTIQLACERFLHGKTVYGPADEIKLGGIIPYLPAMWIPFLPSVILHFDARWTTVAFLFIFLAIAMVPTVKKRTNLPLIPSLIAGTALFLLLNYLLQKNIGFWAMTQEPVVAGFYLLLGFALLRNNFWLIGFAITCCTLSRYSLLMWIPVYFGYVFFTQQRRDFWKLFIAFSVSMLLLFIIPFFVWNPSYFINIPETYESALTFLMRNNVEEHAYQTVGLYKFFSYSNAGLMLPLGIITSFLSPFILFALVKWQQKRQLNTRYAGYGSLKLSLAFFYGFIQAPYTYLSFVPTILSFAVLFYFLTDIEQQEKPDVAYAGTPFYMKKNSGAWLAIIITTILLFVYYSGQIIDANNLNYGQWGDGYKNYYSLAYYLKNDTGTHFTGMNYPYGENVIFTDNQPVIAWLLKPVCKIFPALTNNIHALVTWFIFLSIVIAAYLIYRILKELELSEWAAALFAVLIAVMAPQMLRLMGHYALAYSCFIPLVILLLIRYFKTGGSYRIFAWLALTLSFFTFIHIYYTGMAGMFILLIAGMYAIANIRELKKHIRFISLLITAAVIPFAILKTYLFLFDPIRDRPHSPWGFIDSRATAADIFLHRYSFTGEVIGQLFPKAKIVYHFEGSGYVGLITVLTMAVLLVLTIGWFKKAKALNERYYVYTFLLPAVCVLLYSMAFPFSIPGMEQYYDKMPGAVKQFRASGRFNWIFYYTATIYTAVLVYHLFQNLVCKQKKVLAGLLMLTVISVWFIELNMIGNRYAKDFKLVSNPIDEAREKKELLEQFYNAKVEINNFQAILSFPFFLNGSERIYLDNGTAFEAMKTSLYTGLPIIDTKLSRSSEYQTFRLANLLSSPYIKKDIISDFKNNKPLLLMACENNFSSSEWAIINKGRLLFTMGDKKYFELPLSAFADSTGAAKHYLAANKSKLINHGSYLSDDSTDNVVAIRYETELNEHAAFGKGSHYIDEGIASLYDGPLPNAKDNGQYIISIWSISDARRAAFPVIFSTQNDASGNEVERYDVNPKFSTNTFGKWVRTEVEFTLHNKKNKITMYGNDRFQSYDELMIRPKGVTVITGLENDSTFMFNNFPIR